MLKLILVAVLVYVVFSQRGRVRDLIDAVKRTPQSFREGKQRAEDPAGAAKQIDGRVDD